VITLRAMQHYGCKGYDGGGAWNKVNGGLYKPWIDAFVDQFTKRYVADPGYRYQYWDRQVYPYGHFVRWPTRPGAVILEPDALGFLGRRSNCLTRSARASRLALLTYAARKISALPNVDVYIDAGASDWLTAREAVSLLRRAGVQYARGFALNSTHFQSTGQELRYGDRIARAIGKHYVINTAENANGSLPKRAWTAGTRSKWCNPRNAGLGAQPTSRTASKWADAYLWISRPGISSNGKVGVKACGVGPIGNVWFELKGLWEARQASFSAPAWPPKPM
jgi:endoglucanase